MKSPGVGWAVKSTTPPPFEYFLETLGEPVTPEHPLWRRPLPIGRHAFAESPPTRTVQEETISIGDYFQAVRTFLEGSGQGAFTRAHTQRGSDASAVKAVRIFLAKHGEYYHPARVETEIKGSFFQWVVNVAVSAAGTSLLFKEYALLERLGREFPVTCLPAVYGAGKVAAGRDRPLAMFLGEWLPDFHEFHLTRDTPDGRQAVVLWDPENGPRRLDTDQACSIYHQIARILTHYFDLTSFEAVRAWHHAAGDFVVRLKEGQPEVRLISVREYQPLFRRRPAAGDAPHAIKLFLEALLIFLLNLSVRTRLDRLDGTGELAWSDPVAVEATVAGVLDGLSEKEAPFNLPLPMEPLFRRYLAACSEEDLLSLSMAIVERNYPPDSPEHPLLERRLKEHAATLAQVMSQL